MVIAGIDYGAQIAGTTCIAIKTVNSFEVVIYSSQKGKSADSFLEKCILEYCPKIIGIDAPLSLPLFFFNPDQYPDNVFRKCDRELSAMSPMFLGGLTSRAIKFQYEIQKQLDVECIEVYPKALSSLIGLENYGYKKEPKNITICFEKLYSMYPLLLKQELRTWHEFDAILALVISEKYFRNNALKSGNEEGFIYY